MKQLIFILFIGWSAFAFCSTPPDSTQTKKEIRLEKKLVRLRKDSANRKPVKAPKKPFSVKGATLLSTFLPGAGQIYNARAKRYYNQFRPVQDRQKVHAWWKVPIIYAGLGVSAYYIYKNDKEVKDLRKEYNFRIDNSAPFGDADYAQYDNQAILTIHDQYQTYRDISIVTFSIFYLLNIVDAAVEAHFVNFDISDNLSMNITPSYLPQSNAFGLGMRFNFK